MGSGGAWAYGERSSDDAVLAVARRCQEKGIVVDMRTFRGRRKREPTGCELQTGLCVTVLGKNVYVTVLEDKHKKSSVHTALCLNRQVSN